jgi:hypothetical protein
MIDTGSQLVDVVIALSFIFFLLSLACSGIMEAISSALKLRAKHLEGALRDLLADKQGDAKRDTAEELMDHPLVARFSSKRRKTPSYLSSRTFALALLDTLAPADEVAGQTPAARNKNLLRMARAEIKKLPSEAQRQLLPLLNEAEEDVGKFRKVVEGWFDDAMDRVSGAYKRKTSWIVLGVATVLTVSLNVSTIRIADRLWDDATLREAVTKDALAEVNAQEAGTDDAQEAAEPQESSKADLDQGASSEEDPFKGIEQGAEKSKKALDRVDALALPIGWSSANDNFTGSLAEVLGMLVGWLITVIAIWLGAPFWFDVLSRFARMRNTGVKPDEGSAGGTGG